MPPSPVKHTTVLLGSAHLTPREPGKAQPNVPKHRMKRCRGRVSWTMVDVQMPAWPVSVTTTPPSGGKSVISLHNLSGLIGTSADSRWGLSPPTHSSRSPCACCSQGEVSPRR
jgi:hypothetical protein